MVSGASGKIEVGRWSRCNCLLLRRDHSEGALSSFGKRLHLATSAFSQMCTPYRLPQNASVVCSFPVCGIEVASAASVHMPRFRAKEDRATHLTHLFTAGSPQSCDRAPVQWYPAAIEVESFPFPSTGISVLERKILCRQQHNITTTHPLLTYHH